MILLTLMWTLPNFLFSFPGIGKLYQTDGNEKLPKSVGLRPASSNKVVTPFAELVTFANEWGQIAASVNMFCSL